MKRSLVFILAITVLAGAQAFAASPKKADKSDDSSSNDVSKIDCSKLVNDPLASTSRGNGSSGLSGQKTQSAGLVR